MKQKSAAASRKSTYFFAKTKVRQVKNNIKFKLCLLMTSFQGGNNMLTIMFWLIDGCNKTN